MQLEDNLLFSQISKYVPCYAERKTWIVINQQLVLRAIQLIWDNYSNNLQTDVNYENNGYGSKFYIGISDSGRETLLLYIFEILSRVKTAVRRYVKERFAAKMLTIREISQLEYLSRAVCLRSEYIM